MDIFVMNPNCSISVSSWKYLHVLLVCGVTWSTCLKTCQCVEQMMIAGSSPWSEIKARKWRKRTAKVPQCVQQRDIKEIKLMDGVVRRYFSDRWSWMKSICVNSPPDFTTVSSLRGVKHGTHIKRQARIHGSQTKSFFLPFHVNRRSQAKWKEKKLLSIFLSQLFFSFYHMGLNKPWSLSHKLRELTGIFNSLATDCIVVLFYGEWIRLHNSISHNQDWNTVTFIEQ